MIGPAGPVLFLGLCPFF